MNRIIKQTKGGFTKYYPQYRWMLLWFIPIWIYYSEGTAYEWFYDEDDARLYIDQQEAHPERKARKEIIYV